MKSSVIVSTLLHRTICVVPFCSLHLTNKTKLCCFCLYFSDEDEGLEFEIKSLDKLKSEKMAKAKQILGEFPVCCCLYGFVYIRATSFADGFIENLI